MDAYLKQIKVIIATDVAAMLVGMAQRPRV